MVTATKERTEEAQRLVVLLEAGQIEWANVLTPLFDLPALDPSDCIKYADELYYRFRLIEAGAYHFRVGGGHEGEFEPGITNLVAWAQLQEATIRSLLPGSREFPAEEMKRRDEIEGTLNWALGRLDAFEIWIVLFKK